jgi:hypothetical protein
VRILILAALMLVAPSATTDSGDPYQWMLLSPEGIMYDAEGESVNIRLWEPGTWFTSLKVMYAHEAEGGGYWVARANQIYHVDENPDLIFGDGFDSRTPLARWDRIEGGL